MTDPVRESPPTENPSPSTPRPFSLRLPYGFAHFLPWAIALGLVALSLALSVWGMGWGLPGDRGWAADEVMPDRVLAGLNQGFANGWHDKYPPLPFYLLALLYGPWLLLARAGAIDLGSLAGYSTLVWVGRWLSAALGAGLLLELFALGRGWFGLRAGALGALAAAASCTHVYYSKTGNLDVPYLVGFFGFLWVYRRLLARHRLRDYLLAAILAAVTVGTKDQAYGFFVLTPFAAIASYRRHRQLQGLPASWARAACDRRVLAGWATGLVAFLAIHNVAFNWTGAIAHFNLILYGDSAIRPRFADSWAGQAEMLAQSVRHLRFAMGWPLFLLAAIGLVLWAIALVKSGGQECEDSDSPNPRSLLACLVPFLSYYLFYIVPILYNDVRYLMPFILLAALFAGKAISDGWRWVEARGRSPWKLAAIAAIVAVFAYSLAYGTSVNRLMVADSRYGVERWMRANLPPETRILALGIDKYLPRLHDYPTEFVENPTWDDVVRFTAGEASPTAPAAIVTSSGFDARRFPPDSPIFQTFDRLDRGRLGYREILRDRVDPPGILLDLEELRWREGDRMKIHSNFDKINPEIRIFANAPPAAAIARPAPAASPR